MCVRMYVRALIGGQIAIRTHGKHAPPEHTPPEKRGTRKKPEYICMIADDEKKSIKKVKKNL